MAAVGTRNGFHQEDFFTSAARKLRRIVEDPNAFLVCPGVYDGFSARIALQVGFDGLYMVRVQFEYYAPAPSFR